MRARLRRRRLFLRRAVATVIGAVVVASGSGVAEAQGSSDNLRILSVDSSNHPEVVLTVEPPSELAVTDLTSEHFSLVENGEPLDVQVARSDIEVDGTREILEVVLVIDTSGSMEGAPLEGAKAAASAFLAQMPEDTRVGLVVFGDTPQVLTPLSTDVGAVEAAVAGLEASGETALYDGLNTALEQFGDGDRHAVVLLSDGGDTASQLSVEAIATNIEEFGAESLDFAALELLSPEYDGTALQTLADVSEGSVLSAENPGQLATLYEGVAADLLNRYKVTYTSETGGSTEIALSVEAADLTAETSRRVVLPNADGSVAIGDPSATLHDEPGFLGSSGALYLGLGLFFGALLLGAYRALNSRREVQVRLANRFGGAQSRLRLPALSGLADGAVAFAERRLQHSGREPALERALERAGLEWRPGEFVVLGAFGAIVGVALGIMLSGVLMGVVLGVLVAGAFPVWLRYKGNRRCKTFADQLADTLQLLTGNLRAGHSILQAMDSVAQDSSSPTREEFQRLVVEIRLGREITDALWAMHQRVGNQDFEWFVQALEIHREIGGDLAEILDTVAKTIRERSRLYRQVRTLSAEGRLSAIILFALPFVVALFVNLTSPGYFNELFNTGPGLALVAAACSLMTAGFFWLRKLVQLDF